MGEHVSIYLELINVSDSWTDQNFDQIKASNIDYLPKIGPFLKMLKKQFQQVFQVLFLQIYYKA